jgi:hypothetical protein
MGFIHRTNPSPQEVKDRRVRLTDHLRASEAPVKAVRLSEALGAPLQQVNNDLWALLAKGAVLHNDDYTWTVPR